ncbi:HigA family addiction module antitoxin [Mucilaginibacter sp. RB4R14]|uniref:HigA family addiction module antitoxin n=1 Tax=Mucilaginibacter aurantiaciroseus TaxID=2949308 RepID=UPI0020904D0D|nr:HigA family addiction module antitoxin [Mucilaginibacter aurantiaciroseus]MCO5936391.1 HigA family addiction module antitoxin [Mucilaginibacter aurantiaciroseus]
MEKLPNIHPGKILLEEFLLPLDATPYRLAKETHIPQTRIYQIIKGNRRIAADTALRFSRFFCNSAKFWLGLQDDFDIEDAMIKKHAELIISNNLKALNFVLLQHHLCSAISKLLFTGIHKGLHLGVLA